MSVCSSVCLSVQELKVLIRNYVTLKPKVLCCAQDMIRCWRYLTAISEPESYFHIFWIRNLSII